MPDNKAFDNTNRFVLFRNEKKTKDNQPDYRGEITISADELRRAAAAGGDVKFRLSGWIHTAKNDGKAYLSGRVSPDEDVQATAGAYATSAPPANSGTVGFGEGQTHPF